MAEREEERKNRDADTVGNEAELIGRIIQSEQKLSEYFTTIITKSVTEQIERRNLARLRLFGVVSVILISVIIPAVTLWIRGAITSQTETAIQTQFSEALEQMEVRFGDQTKKLEQDFETFLDAERTYLTFANYAIYLADRSQVPEREIKNVLAVLEQIADNPHLTSRPDFPFLVDLIVRTAIRHDYTNVLDTLEENLHDVLVASSRTMPRLARYYGESIVGDHFTSRQRLESSIEKFHRYMDLSHGGPDFELLLPIQMMVEKTLDSERSRERIGSIQLYLKDLLPTQQAAFIGETIRYSNPDYRDMPATANNRRIAGAAGNLVVDEAQFYAEMIKDNAVQAALTQLASREANLENMGIANALTAFRRVFVRGLLSADDPKLEETVRKFVSTEIRPWLGERVIIDALKQQNRKTESYSREQIEELEQRWQNEFVSDQYNLIAEVLDQPVSRHLKRVKDSGLGMYQEILLMDGKGLLAGASDPNSDYWQGEEAKWLDTYGKGKGSLHIDKLRFDESALAWQIQVSLPVFDPETGEPLGAITVGLDPSALADGTIR